MKLCDRCPQAGSCLLNYLGKACHKLRTVILNGDQVYCDELIRENARLTIQHEADRLTLEQMREQCVSSEECTAKVAEAYARADKAKRDAEALNSKLRQAVADLHFVMAGGDACKVCTVKCAFGEGNCKPVWRGEDGADL